MDNEDVVMKQRPIEFNMNVLLSDKCRSCLIVQGDTDKVTTNPVCAHCKRVMFMKADHYYEM